MPKTHFALKLIPPRATFIQDMTADERNIMQQHQVYWRKLLADGIVLVYGPVLDPAGPYGFGIVAVDSEEQLKQLMAVDPANGLNKYEWYPMMAVVHPSFTG